LRIRAVGALVSLATVASLMIPPAAVRAADGKADFDWSMPPRTGLDENDDGVIDVRGTRSDIDPPSWTVHFDACASEPTAGASITRFGWYLDQKLLAEGRACGGFSHQFPDEGVYEITLAIEDSSGAILHTTRQVPVQDWLIVAIGDSLGSGQGNPDIPIPGISLDAVNQARTRLYDRLRELGDVEDAYEETAGLVSTARTRYNQLMDALDHQADVCNPLSGNFDAGACTGSAPEAVAAATIALTDALLAVGLEALMATLYLIEDSLDELVEAAAAAVETAQAAVQTATISLDEAKAAAKPTWQNKRCNRSSISSQAQAALRLEESDPRTSVTLVHLSCSGAQIMEGLLGDYMGVEYADGANPLPPQVDRAEGLIGGREVDAVLVSIGVNDVGFGHIVEACITQEPCHDPPTSLQAAIDVQIQAFCALQSIFDDDCVEWWSELERVRSAKEIFDAGAALLPTGYDRLADRLGEAFPAIAAHPDRVFITEYPNAIENEDGERCSADDYDAFHMLPGISPAEAVWLDLTVTRELNGLVAAGAAAHGWTPVTGMFEAFAGHGYCSTDSWIRRIQDSFVMQGTKEGTAHPTREGHAVYREHIREALLAGLYPPVGGTGGGNPSIDLPRQPDLALAPGHDTLPPVVTGVPDRTPNAAGWYTDSVAIDWQAADPLPSSGTPTDPADTTAGTEGTVEYESGQSCDPVGRCATGKLTLSIDRTPPDLACPAPAPAFGLGSAGATVSAAVSDALSGPATATSSAAADTATVGAKTVAITGADIAGNERTVSCPYLVTYAFGGFASPVDEGGTLNVAKAGRGIPLKWHLEDASGAPVATLTTARVTVQALDCGIGTSPDAVEETTAGESGLQNLGGGDYQLNWKSPSSYAGSCKTLRLDLGEGLVHTALFKFTK
jgi:hypothetical protein